MINKNSGTDIRSAGFGFHISNVYGNE